MAILVITGTGYLDHIINPNPYPECPEDYHHVNCAGKLSNYELVANNLHRTRPSGVSPPGVVCAVVIWSYTYDGDTRDFITIVLLCQSLLLGHYYEYWFYQNSGSDRFTSLYILPSSFMDLLLNMSILLLWIDSIHYWPLMTVEWIQWSIEITLPLIELGFS